MAFNLDQILIHIIVSVIIVSPSLWISGRLLAGKGKAKLTDAIWIAALGTIIGGIIQYVATGIIASIIILLIWLALVKHFFDCGWIKALIIAVVAVIIFIAIAMLLALIFGIALIGFVGLSGIII